MAEEIVFKTRVDTGNTVKDVDSITKAISKTEIEVDKLSKKYGENSKEADKARKELAKLDLQLNETAKSTTNLDGKFEDFYGDLQPLTGRIGELEDRLYELALAGQQNTQEFRDLQAETVRYKQTIISVDKAVDQLQESGKGLGTALQIGGAVVAGYGAVQGAVALLGVENENFEKTLIKLQSAQALLNGIQELKIILDKESLVVTKAKVVWDKIQTVGTYAYTTAVGTSTGAMKLLKLAMLSLPIVAIIAGVVALASAMDLFGDSAEEAREKQKKLHNEQLRQLAINQSFTDKDLAKATETSDKKLELMKAQGVGAKELYETEREALRKRQIALEAQSEGGIKMSKAQYQLYKDTLQSIKVLDATHQKELSDDQAKSEEDRAKKRLENKAKKLQAEKDEQSKRLELARLTEDLIIENIDDSNLKAIEQLRVKHEREKTDLITKFGEDTALLKELTTKQSNEINAFNDTLLKNQNKKDQDTENKDAKSRIEGKIINLRAEFEAEQDAKLELAQLEMDQALQNTELTEGEIFKIKESYALKVDEINKNSKDKEIANQKAIQEAGFNIANQSIQSIQSLSDLAFTIKNKNLEKGSKAELENAKKQFETNKKLQIASATIAGIQGVINALTAPSVVPEPFGSVLKGITATAIGLTTASNIAKISSAKFDGGDSSASVSAPPTPLLPNVDVSGGQGGGVGDVSTSQVSSVGLVNNQTGIKVSVVDSEIKAVMDNSANVNVISTIGG